MVLRPLSVVLVVLGLLGWIAGAVYLILASDLPDMVLGGIGLSQLLAAVGWGMSVENRLGNIKGRLDEM